MNSPVEEAMANPPTLTLLTAGYAQAGVQWTAPTDTGGKPINKYTVYAMPCPSTPNAQPAGYHSRC